MYMILGFCSLFCYLLGSVPFGLVLSKIFYNTDLRNIGSGNIGATNAARVGGMKLGIATFLFDGLKGLVAGLIGLYLFNHSIAALFCGIAFFGHLFPIFLKFKGGKGISVVVFSLFLLNYIIGFIFITTWLIVFLFTKYSSLSAILAIIVTNFCIYTLAIYFDNQISLSLLCFTTVVTCLVILKHIPNIQRLILGTEHKFKK